VANDSEPDGKYQQSRRVALTHLKLR